MGADYTLDIQIAPEDLRVLKESGYKLCLARKCNGTYTVVWDSIADFLQRNEFRWTEKYQVFGAGDFKAGALVRASTNTENIASGQVCELDQNGVMQPAAGIPDTSGKFSVDNQFRAIAFGVEGQLGDRFLPIYVTPYENPVGRVTFEPEAEIKVWFSSQEETGTMISSVGGSAIEVSYEGGATRKSIVYENGVWAFGD